MFAVFTLILSLFANTQVALANVWINPGEDLDGDTDLPGGGSVGDPDDTNDLDDDENGYVDDFFGWDFVSICNGFEGEDCSGEDNNPADIFGHGTLCSGVAAACTNNATGMASLSWNSRLMCLRVGYMGADSIGYVIQNAAAQAMSYAMQNGANIISLGVGGSAVLRTAAEAAWNQGLLCVHAAGNGASDYQSPLDMATGIVSVAATDAEDCLVCFSNYGAWIDICAPGVDLLSTENSGGYLSFSGTSAAGALVASQAAMIWNVSPELLNAEVRGRLLATADNIDTLECNQFFASQLGEGRVNAYRAAYDLCECDLQLLDLQTCDSNGDGRYSGGEEVVLSFLLENQGLVASDSIRCELSTTDAFTSITQSEIVLESLEAGESRSVAFNAQLELYGPVRYVPFHLSCTTDNDPAHVEQDVEIMVGTPRILLYDDAPISDGIYDYYYSGMRANNRLFDWYQSASQSFPLLPNNQLDLQEYTTILYASGSSISTVDDEEQGLLRNWLEEGELLLFSSQHALNDLSGGSFLADVLYAIPVEEESYVLMVRGSDTPDMPFMQFELQLSGAGGANNQQAPLHGMAAADGDPYATLFQDSESLFSLGVTHENVLFLGFALEASADVNGENPIVDVLADTFWLDVAQSSAAQPTSSCLTSIWPNPFNPVTQISFELTQAACTRLSVYNLLGQEVARLTDGSMPAGAHRLSFHADGLAAGLYLVLLEIEGEHVDVQKLLLTR